MNEGDTGLAAFSLAVFLVTALALAGFIHVLWLRSRWSRHFRQPIDGGMPWRGKRLLGDNKTVGGLIAMPPASAFSFSLLAALSQLLPEWFRAGLWTVSLPAYAAVGFLAGLAFMCAELPNSFLKRRLGVDPGKAGSGMSFALLLILDRFDSTIGVLIVLSLLMPVSFATWGWVLLLGPTTHFLFSFWLSRLGIKERSL